MNPMPNSGSGWLLSPFLQDVATLDTHLDVFTQQKVLLTAPAPIGALLTDKTQRANEHVPRINPGIEIRSVITDTQGGLWIAAENSLYYHTQGATLEISGKEGLPVRDIRCLALSAEGALWVGSGRGAARLYQGKWRYYAGRRWLPDDRVASITLEANGDAWIATAQGVSKIAFMPMTFARKAAHYESITASRHNRDGYVTDCHLERSGDLESFLYEASDNDGLWTALYICSESFRYAVTGDSNARELARKSMHALLDLVRVTGIPGFPARALIRAGERVRQSDPGSNWHPSPTLPGVLYKDDTSSDEVDGHYLAWYIYSELVADAQERRMIADVCRAVTDHILQHNYTLVGPTGKPTTWGVWSPERLNADPQWRNERGLNSLEILSHLRVAMHLCNEPRHAVAYRSLIEDHGYALNAVRQKVVPPEGENNHSDDELAACAYYPLLQLETEPHLRALYLWSLERTQAVLRPEGSPFHNVIYGACTGNPSDVERAVQWLQDAPWDLRAWTMTNSHRSDITFEERPGRFGERQSTHPLPPNERRVAKWNHNPYNPDGGSDGHSEEDGTFWLLPYWMGRYHAIFREDPEAM